MCWYFLQLHRKILKHQLNNQPKSITESVKMKGNSGMPYPSQALGCNKSFPTFSELKGFFIYFTFVQPSIKAGMTQENKVYKQGRQAFPELTVGRFWLEWAAGPGHVTGSAKEVGFGSSCLTPRRLMMKFCSWNNTQNRQVKLAYFC